MLRPCYLAFAVVVLCVLAQRVDGARPQQHVRRVGFTARYTIASRLLPDDEIVQLVRRRGDLIVTPGRPLTVDQMLEDLAVRSDVVVLSMIDATDCVLAIGDSWIDSRLIGTVTDVLRVAKGRSVAPGQPLEVHESGGAMTIGRVLVQAVGESYIVPRFPSQRQYLLFLRHDDKGTLRPPHTPMLVQGNRLVYSWRKPLESYEPQGGLEATTLDHVRKVVKRAKKSWLCGKCESSD